MKILTKILPRYSFISYFYGFCMFLLMMPYFMWDTGKLRQYIQILIIIIGLINRRKIEKIDLFVFPFFSLLLLYLSLVDEVTVPGGVLTQLIVIFLLVDRTKMLGYFNCFKLFFTISLFFSLINYALVIFSVRLSYNIIEPLNSLKDTTYIQYPFLVYQNINLENIFPRFYGVFDEPGVVGTFAAIILYAERYNFKKISNIVLFISGALSFSFFFIILTFISIIIFYKKKYIFIFAFSVSLFFVLTRNDPVIYNYAWQRLELVNGKFKGDNRSGEELDIYFKSFVKSDDLLLGRGVTVDLGSASYKQFLIRYGLFFSVFFLILFVIIATQIAKNKKEVFISILLLLLLMYQRPFILDPAYFFLVVCSFILISKTSEIIYLQTIR